MSLRGAEGAISDTMHVIFTIVMILFLLSSIGFGAAALGKRFRLYSIGIILILLLFGALAGMDGSRIAARINIYASLLWVLVLAITLLRAEKGQGSVDGN